MQYGNLSESSELWFKHEPKPGKNWASSWDYGNYHIGDQPRLWRACTSAQPRQSFCCSLTWIIVDEGSDQKSDIWMAAHARLENEFTDDEKCHISWAGSIAKWNVRPWKIQSLRCPPKDGLLANPISTRRKLWSGARVILLVLSCPGSVSNIWAATCRNQRNDLCAQRRQISLGIRPVLSESSFCALMIDKDPRLFLHTDSEDWWMYRLISVFARRICHSVGFVMLRLITNEDAQDVPPSKSAALSIFVIKICN